MPIALKELVVVLAAELAVASLLVFYVLVPIVDAGPPTWLLRALGYH